MDKNNITGGIVMGLIAGATVGLAAAGLLENPGLGAVIGVVVGVVVLLLFLRSVSRSGEQAGREEHESHEEEHDERDHRDL